MSYIFHMWKKAMDDYCLAKSDLLESKYKSNKKIDKNPLKDSKYEK